MKIIYEDTDLQVVDKPAGVAAEQFEKRAHRIDKDTSGILLLAKNEETLEFLQKQFKNREISKKYTALVVGDLKGKIGTIETLLGRSPKDRRKQKVYFSQGPKAAGKRTAITEYKVLERFNDFTLLEVQLRTGRKHQIRAHFAYLGHPLAGDKLYGFKNQFSPPELKRQFLHASYLKIKLPGGETKEFKSELANDLKLCLQKLRHSQNHN